MSDPPRSTGRRALRLLLAAGVGAAVGAYLTRARHGGGPPPGGPVGFLDRLFDIGFRPAVTASILVWLAFSLYWSWAARGASLAASAESKGSRLVHLVVITTGQVLVLLPVPGLRARLWPASWPVMAVGLAVELAALALAVWARRTLGRHWSGEITVKVEHELVTQGPYARVRHPIYAAMLALCVGTLLVWGELHALVGTLLVAASYVRKIRLEERVLAGRFGDEWEGYRARTRALVPGVF
jgi:protein-S-isoprenylcysteine O-methyltransferase Ste14